MSVPMPIVPQNDGLAAYCAEVWRENHEFTEVLGDVIVQFSRHFAPKPDGRVLVVTDGGL